MRTRIYTDGACSGNPGPGGWGAIILLDEEAQEISGNNKLTTNNRMELTAVIEALHLASILGIKDAEIYSDSAYIVNAINENWIKKWEASNWQTIGGSEVKNKDLWKRLLSALKKIDVQFVKVKGHSGDIYNEKADKLAGREVERAKQE